MKNLLFLLTFIGIAVTGYTQTQTTADFDEVLAK